MVADQEPPVDVVKAGLRQAVEHLMRDHQRLAVGCEGQAADVVRRQRPDRVDRSPLGIDHRQPAAEGIGDDQLGTVGDDGQLARAKRQVERADDRERGRKIGRPRRASPTNVSRRDQREATTQNEPSADTTSRTGSGLTLIRSTTRIDRS